MQRLRQNRLHTAATPIHTHGINILDPTIVAQNDTEEPGADGSTEDIPFDTGANQSFCVDRSTSQISRSSLVVE